MPSSALKKLEKKVKKLERKTKKDTPEAIITCLDLNDAITSANFYDFTEDLWTADSPAGIKIRLQRMIMRILFTVSDGNSVDGSVNFRIIVAKSKVGALVTGDFPTTTYSCVNRNKMAVYVDKVYNVHASAMLAGPLYYGYNNGFLDRTRTWKSGIVQTRAAVDDVDNFIYGKIIMDNYTVGGLAQGQVVFEYTDN